MAECWPPWVLAPRPGTSKPGTAILAGRTGNGARDSQRIVNNARFLILPWVQCHGLASRILSGILPPLRTDWRLRYGYQPLLLETFVEVPRFTGTAYRAANWLRLGQTRGRGKLEKQHVQIAPLKDVWVVPVAPGLSENPLCRTLNPSQGGFDCLQLGGFGLKGSRCFQLNRLSISDGCCSVAALSARPER